MLSLSNLKTSLKSKKGKRVLGRGNASGTGNFSTRGVKGQRSRTGGSNKLKRLGMRHIIMQTPKLRGFASLYGKPVVINVGDLEKIFQAGDKVTPLELAKRGLIDKKNAIVKILGDGQLTKRLEVSGCLVSGPALEKIKKAGGTILSQPGVHTEAKSMADSKLKAAAKK